MSHPDKFQLRKCGICGQGYSSSFSAHFESFHKMQRCPHCEKTFGNKRSLNIHLEQWRCPIFKLVDPEKRAFLCRKTEDGKWKCGICEGTFANVKNLRVHHLRVHLKVRNHKCNLCDRSFTRPSDLRRHHQNVHLNIRRFECNWPGCS